MRRKFGSATASDGFFTDCQLMRRSDRTRLKKCISPVLVLFLILSISGCGIKEENEKAVIAPEVEWQIEENNIPGFAIKLGDCHITSAYLLEDDKITALSEEEYKKISAKKDYGVVEKSKNQDFSVDEIFSCMDFRELERTTPLYKKAFSFSLGDKLTFERKAESPALSEISGLDIETIDRHMLEFYGLPEKGESYAGNADHEQMYPTGMYQYATIAFLPKIAVVNGKYVKNGKETELHLKYPVVGTAGYMNGIFLMIESDDTDFEELQDLGD